MNVETGELRQLSQREATQLTPESPWIAVDIQNIPMRIRERMEKYGIAKIGRNTRCPCGSGKRFKRCCMVFP